MAWIIPRKERHREVAGPSTEVDFALTLSRMINSASADPEQLRTSVYELARYKLQEQVAEEHPAERDRLENALEVAIQGVETHFNRVEARALAAPEGQSRLSLPASKAAPQVVTVIGPGNPRPAPPAMERLYKPERRGWEFSAPWRYVAVLALIAVVGFAIQQRGNLAALQTKAGSAVAAIKAASKPVQASSERTPPQQEIGSPQQEIAPARDAGLVPTTFGVYAVSDGKLHTLETLPGRAPDPRVAISAAILTPSKTMLPDRHIKFIVFRRDSATNALDHVEVRVTAKIAQAMKFDPAGKPIVTKAEDSWVIRNITYPFRTAPLKGQPDMYEVVGEEDKLLEPGRYVLVLKGEAYDFSVAGEIKDPRQCLESIAAANGSFYTECQKR
jgi:hypothetical protein